MLHTVHLCPQLYSVGFNRRLPADVGKVERREKGVDAACVGVESWGAVDRRTAWLTLVYRVIIGDHWLTDGGMDGVAHADGHHILLCSSGKKARGISSKYATQPLGPGDRSTATYDHCWDESVGQLLAGHAALFVSRLTRPTRHHIRRASRVRPWGSRTAWVVSVVPWVPTPWVYFYSWKRSRQQLPVSFSAGEQTWLRWAVPWADMCRGWITPTCNNMQ